MKKAAPKKRTVTPQTRSIEYLEAEGWLVGIGEYWIPNTFIRRDLWGFADLVAIRGQETLAVQVTTTDHQAERIRKITEHPNVGRVREAGWGIHVHGWLETASGQWALTVTDIS